MLLVLDIIAYTSFALAVIFGLIAGEIDMRIKLNIQPGRTFLQWVKRNLGSTDDFSPEEFELASKKMNFMLFMYLFAAIGVIFMIVRIVSE